LVALRGPWPPIKEKKHGPRKGTVFFLLRFSSFSFQNRQPGGRKENENLERRREPQWVVESKLKKLRNKGVFDQPLAAFISVSCLLSFHDPRSLRSNVKAERKSKEQNEGTARQRPLFLDTRALFLYFVPFFFLSLYKYWSEAIGSLGEKEVSLQARLANQESKSFQASTSFSHQRASCSRSPKKTSTDLRLQIG